MTEARTALPGWDARRVHALVLGLAGLWVVSFFVTTGFARDVVVSAVALAPAVAVVAVLRGRRLRQPEPWWFVLAGLCLLSTHNAVWLVEVYALEIDPPGSVPSALLLPLGYLMLLLGAVVMLRQAVRQDSGTIIDAAIIALSGVLLLWVLLLAPALDESVPTHARVRTMAILAVVSGIGGALYRAAAVLRERRGSLMYMLTAVVGTVGGTLGRDMSHSEVQGDGAWWVGLLWVVAYIALVGGVLHPSATTAVVERTDTARLTPRRVWALAVALSIGPGLLILEAVTDTAADAVYIAAVNLALVPLVVLRVGRLAQLHADAERRLAYLADHDDLTGLPNRRALQRHLERLLGRVAAGTAPGAVVLFADLDDFKVVNDTLGHRVGDELLRAVAQRLRRTVRSGGRPGDDLVVRFAGDEFVIVIEGDPALADRAVERLHTALADDVVLGEHVLPAGASVGVATVAPGTRVTLDELLSAADARMYERKRERRTAPVDDRVL